MLCGEYEPDSVRLWCYCHLYGIVAKRANAIAKLIEDSYMSAAFALLRSNMETFATCHYISERLACRSTLCHDFIAYSFLWAVYKMKSYDTTLRQRHRMKASFPAEQFVPLKKVPKERFKAFEHPLAWIDPCSKKVTTNTGAIVEAAEKKYAKLYNLGNLEVHGNIVAASQYAALGTGTPTRVTPTVAVGEEHFFNWYDGIEFDYLTAEIVVRTTKLYPNFLKSLDGLTQKAKGLIAIGDGVLQNLSWSKQTKQR